MSWDSYIDNLIAQSKDSNGESNTERACIIGLDGGAKWTTDAHSNSLKLTPEECSQIAACFKNSDYNTFMQSGVRCEGQKYQFLRAVDGVVLAKKKELGSLTIQSSKTAIVIAFTPDQRQQGLTNKAVGIIADYLESMNM